jgi:hypothetical protein
MGLYTGQLAENIWWAAFLKLQPLQNMKSTKQKFAEEREQEFQDRVGSDMVWDGENEPNPHRQIPALPMKWHSNKWVAKIFK